MHLMSVCPQFAGVFEIAETRQEEAHAGMADAAEEEALADPG